jgi:signal transduction histidine kinase
VRALVVEAHEDVRASILELRALAQGIHPVALAGGDLGDALELLAGRSPIPVDLVVELDGRIDEEIERTAYFVAAEAVTNAIRHSGATFISIRAGGAADRLLLQVSDDGDGRATVRAGGGLAGLIDRVESVGGRLTVDAAAGRGTTVTAHLMGSAG